MYMNSRRYICTAAGIKITVQKWPAKYQISSTIDLTCHQSTSQCPKTSTLLQEFLLLGDKQAT